MRGRSRADLTPEQVEAAKACGCAFFPATEAQVARLSMQRRVFRVGGGFFEPHATLLPLI